jgi:uncharacterized protein (DUF111 family)
MPPGVRVLSVQPAHHTDWEGIPALRVNVVIENDTDVVKHTRALADLKDAIHQRLLDHGITLFPYIFFATLSELAETGEV